MPALVEGVSARFLCCVLTKRSVREGDGQATDKQTLRGTKSFQFSCHNFSHFIQTTNRFNLHRLTNHYRALFCFVLTRSIDLVEKMDNVFALNTSSSSMLRPLRWASSLDCKVAHLKVGATQSRKSSNFHHSSPSARAASLYYFAFPGDGIGNLLLDIFISCGEQIISPISNPYGHKVKSRTLSAATRVRIKLRVVNRYRDFQISPRRPG